MNLATRALMGAGATGLTLILVASGGVAPLVLAGLMLVAGVAAATQSLRYQRDERRVYKPVYVRSATVHRRVRYDDR